MWIEIKSDILEYSFELGGVNALKYGDDTIVKLQKESKNLSTEDWIALESKPINATIYFYRTKKANKRLIQLSTKIEVKNPTQTRIIETDWIPE